MDESFDYFFLHVIFLMIIFQGCASTVQHKINNDELSPFCPSSEITFFLTREQNVSIVIYDEKGIIKDTLINSLHSAGKNKIDPDFSSYTGGLYFYKLVSEDTAYVKKFVLIK
jgi:hypothetical protein